MNDALLLEKIRQLPEDKKIKVEDYVNSITKNKNTHKIEKRVVGCGKGMFKILPGFDDPIEGMEEYMQ
jgi:Protein of unknown function (DUF2281)